MTRYAQARPPAVVRSPARVAGAPQRLDYGPEALLALQRQVGNAAVSRMIARSEQREVMPTIAEEESVASESPRVSLDDLSEISFDPAQIVRPSAPSPRTSWFRTVDALTEADNAGSTPWIPEGLPSRPPSLESERPASEPASEADDDLDMPGAWKSTWDHFTGDKSKMLGAAGTIPVPALNMGIVGQTANAVSLGGAATAMASSSAIGDGGSELLKPRPPLFKPAAPAAADPEAGLAAIGDPQKIDNMNVPKLIGAVLSAAGLLTNMGGLVGGDLAARSAGLGLQTAGLAIKGVGELGTWNEISALTQLQELQWADIAKGVGAFSAAAGAGLQIKALQLQQRLREQGATGAALTPDMLWIAAILSAGSSGGDAASEIVKGIRTGKLNPYKLLAGLLGASGALTTALGVHFDSPATRFAGLGLSQVATVTKTYGEGRKAEKDPIGDLANWPLVGGHFTERKRREAEAQEHELAVRGGAPRA